MKYAEFTNLFLEFFGQNLFGINTKHGNSIYTKITLTKKGLWCILSKQLKPNESI